MTLREMQIYNKVIRVINSCKTYSQLITAIRYIDLAKEELGTTVGLNLLKLVGVRRKELNATDSGGR